MRERDIVDIEKLNKNDKDEYIDAERKEIGCIHCYIHTKAYDKLQDIQGYGNKFRPMCPKCNKPMSDCAHGYDGAVIVSEQNSYVPDGNIGLYQLAYCEDCDQTYAMMPEPISYNANHDTFYTGGRRFATDEELEKLCHDVASAVMPSINQYIERKMNPQNDYDKTMLTLDNVDLWCERDIEQLICEYLYEKGFKK